LVWQPGAECKFRPNGASASIFQTSASSIGFDNGDDNFEIVFDTPVEAAGLWIGNLGASNNDPVTPTVIQFLSESGTVIFEETVTQSTPGLIGIGANNRIFSGLTSDTPIAQIVVRNAASDGDGIFIDDVLFGALNTGPVAVADDGDGFVTSEDTSFITASVLTNDVDRDADVLTVVAVDPTATLGLVTDNGDGTFDYDPNGQFEALAAGQSGTDSFAYTVSDGNGGTDTATVTVTITGVNDAPVFGAVGPFAVDENTTAVGTVTASDVEGDVVSFSITGGDDGGLFDIDTTTGALSFKTAPDFEAPLDTGADNSYEIQVTVSDGTDTVDTFIFVDVRDVDEGGGVNVIQGTADPFDPLVGTEGRDEIRTGGGPFDDLTGGVGPIPSSSSRPSAPAI